MNEESEGGKESGTCDDEREEFKERKKKNKGRKQGVGADLLFLSLLVCFCGLGDIYRWCGGPFKFRKFLAFLMCTVWRPIWTFPFLSLAIIIRSLFFPLSIYTWLPAD